MSQKQSILGTACEHTIWLFCSLGDKVVNEDPYVPFCPVQHKWVAALNLQSRVRASD